MEDPSYVQNTTNPPIHFRSTLIPTIVYILLDNLLDLIECLLWYDKEDIVSELLLRSTRQMDIPLEMHILCVDNTFYKGNDYILLVSTAEESSRNK